VEWGKAGLWVGQVFATPNWSRYGQLVKDTSNDIRRTKVFPNVLCFLKSSIDQNLIMVISNSMVILKVTSYLRGLKRNSSYPYIITQKIPK
jgi:hypothetical protein